MKIRTKRTALSLAVASLFVIALPVGYATTIGSTTITNETITNPTYYFVSTSANPQNGRTDNPNISAIDDGTLTLTFGSTDTTTSFTVENGTAQFFMVYADGTLTANNLSLVVNNATISNAVGEEGSADDILYLNVVANKMTSTGPGAAGTLTVGDISLSITNSTVTGEVAGYLHQAGRDSNIQTNSGAAVVGNIDVSVSGGTFGTGWGDTGFTGAYIASTDQFNVTIGTADTSPNATPAINVSLSGADESSAVFGVRLRYNTDGTLRINNAIEVSVSGGTEGGSTYGFSDDETNARTATTITGNISVDVEGADEGGTSEISSHLLSGIFESGSASTLTMTGDVSVTAYGLSETTGTIGLVEVQGAFVTGNTTTATGTEILAATMNLTGNISVYLEGIADISSYVAGLETGGTTTVSGDITVTNISEATETDPDATSISGDIYGVYQTGGEATVGNVVVALGGSAANLGDTHSIYGTLSTAGTITVNGTRTLYFGYTTDAQGNPVGAYDLNGVGVAFTSDATNSFVGAFGGFDEVVVTSGSTLYIAGETTLGDPTDADGVEASNGTITLAADTVTSNTPTLTVQSGGTLVVPTIANDAGAVNNEGLITASLEITSAGTINNGTDSDSTASILTGTLSTSGTVTNYGSITADTSITVTAGTVTNSVSGATISTNVLNTSSGSTVSNSRYGAILNIYAVDDGSGSGNSSIAGTFTNSGTVNIGSTAGEGTVTITGALTNNSSARVNLGTKAKLIVDVGGTFTNAAYFTSSGGAVTVNGKFSNSGTDYRYNTSTFYGLTVTGTFENGVATFVDNGVTIITGGGTITNTGHSNANNMTFTKLYVGGDASGGDADGGSITGYGSIISTDTTVWAKGSINLGNTRNFTVVGSLLNYGTIDVGYSETTTGYQIAGELVINSGAIVNNYGAITVGSVDTTSGVTYYNQYDGYFSVVDNSSTSATAPTLASKYWFENAVVTVTGGTLDSYNLGTGNTYTLGNKESSSVNPDTWPDKETDSYAWYSLGVLDNSSTVDLYGGAVLEVVQGISYTSGATNTTKLAGGTLIVDFDWIFDGASYDTLYVEAATEGELDGVTSHVIVTGAGDKINETANNVIYFGTGVVALRLPDDEGTNTEHYFSVGVVTDIITLLDNAEGEGAGDLNVVFDGKFDRELTVGLANKVTSGRDKDATHHGYATYAQDNLFNGTLTASGEYEDVKGTILSVGEAVSGVGTATSVQFTLDNSMGFKSVTSVSEGVYINSGYIFNLVGESSTKTDYTEFTLADLDTDIGAAISVYGSDTEGTNISTLELGNYGVSAKTGGTLSAVNIGIDPDGATAKGRLEVKNGDFVIDELANAGDVVVESNGKSDLSDNASLTVGEYTAYNGSSLLNNASFIADTIVMAKNDTATDTAASITNGNTMTVNGKATFVGNVFNGTEDDTTGTEYAGTLTVKGEASIDGALTNTASSTATFAALSLSGGDSDNAGTMSATSLTVASKATLTNESSATLSLSAASTVAGMLDNLGDVTTADIKVSGEVSNNEEATWDTSGTMTVSADGGVGNGGVMTITTLTTEADSVVGNNVDGTLTVSGDAHVVGTLENTGGTVEIGGTLELVNDDPTLTSAELINTSSGVMKINALVVGEDAEVSNDDGSTITLSKDSSIAGVVTNDGIITANSTLTIEEGADVVNTKTVTAKNLTVTGGSFVTSDTLTADSFAISGGSLSVSGGTFTTKSSTLSGGMVCVGFDCSSNASTTAIKPLADSNSDAVTVELSASGDMGSQVFVADGSKLNLGATGGIEWADGALGNLGIDYSGDLLVMRSTAKIVGSGTISVGSETESGGLYFDGKSTLVVDYNLIGESIYSTSEESKASSAVFVASGATNTTATIADGATLVLVGDLKKEGRYDITQGYSATLEGWKDTFTWGTEDGTVYGLDSSGVGWELAVKTDSDGDVYVVAVKHDDVVDNYDVAIPNIVNEDLNDCSSSASASAVCGILRDDSLTKEEKEQAINSMSNLLFAGGVMATAMTDATAAFDSVVNHLTMDSDTFDKDGNLWPWDKSGNLWIDVTGSWQHSKHLEATKISGYKYRTNSYGFVLGYDQKLTDRPVVLGAAFSFSDGNLKSKGGVSKTKNEYQTYGVSLFGNYSPSPYYNIIGSLHWFHNSADVKQYTSSGKAAAQIQTNLLAVGLRGETTIKAGQVNIVPHVETRYLYGKTSKFNTKLDGTSLWRTNPKGTNTVQFPVGVAFRGDIKTENGWNFRPRVDLTAIPQVGSTKQKSVVRSNGVSDTIDGQFMGKFGGSVKVGMQADKGNATVGVRYGFLGGTKGRADHSVMLQGRYRF